MSRLSVGQDRGSGSVTKEKCGRVIFGIRDARKKFSRYDDQLFCGARSDKGASHFKRIEPPCTGCIEVESESSWNAKLLRQCARHGRNRLIGNQGGHNDPVDFLDVLIRLLERVL